MKKSVDITFHKVFSLEFDDSEEELIKEKFINYIKNNPEQIISGAAFAVNFKEFSKDDIVGEHVIPKGYDGRVFTKEDKAVFIIE